MIEVQILIAVALIGTLLVLVRISLTLKGILEALTGDRSAGSPSVAGAQPGAVGSALGGASVTQGGPVPQGRFASKGEETTPSDDRGAPDTLQDIAAIVAVAERVMRQGSSKPSAS